MPESPFARSQRQVAELQLSSRGSKLRGVADGLKLGAIVLRAVVSAERVDRDGLTALGSTVGSLRVVQEDLYNVGHNPAGEGLYYDPKDVLGPLLRRSNGVSRLRDVVHDCLVVTFLSHHGIFPDTDALERAVVTLWALEVQYDSGAEGCFGRVGSVRYATVFD